MSMPQYYGGDCLDPPEKDCWWDDPAQCASAVECPACGDTSGELDWEGIGDGGCVDLAILVCAYNACRVRTYDVERLTAADRRADRGDDAYHSISNGDRDASRH